MITYQRITQAEANLLDDIQELGYGEILEVEIEAGEAVVSYGLDPKTKALIDLIRNGVSHFKTIKIYDQKPAYAEVPGVTTKSGFKCIRTHKF